MYFDAVLDIYWDVISHHSCALRKVTKRSATIV